MKYHERVYEVHCRTSDLHFDDKSKNYEGTMEGVTGTLFDKDSPVATFSADSGEANKGGKLVLTLHGNVHVIGTAKAPPGAQSAAGDMMTCNDMTWEHENRWLWWVDTPNNFVKAHGSVVVTGKRAANKTSEKAKQEPPVPFKIGPTDELWCDPDRHIYATPDLFPKR